MFYVFATNAACSFNASVDSRLLAYQLARRIAKQYDRVEIHHDDRCLCVIRARKNA